MGVLFPGFWRKTTGKKFGDLRLTPQPPLLKERGSPGDFVRCCSMCSGNDLKNIYRLT